MVRDPVRGRILLFGGKDAAGELGDTWEWDGVGWTQLQPSVTPSLRAGHAMAFDPVRQRIVLFGGRRGASSLGDTWEWDGSGWTLAAPVTRP